MKKFLAKKKKAAGVVSIFGSLKYKEHIFTNNTNPFFKQSNFSDENLFFDLVFTRIIFKFSLFYERSICVTKVIGL